MFDRTEDQHRTWQAFQDTLCEAVTDFVVERPVGVQLFGHLWACLTLHIQDTATPSVLGHTGTLPARTVVDDRQRVLAALQECAPLDRAIWLFSAVTGLSMDSLSELTQRPEPDVRQAHARVSWVVHNALLA